MKGQFNDVANEPCDNAHNLENIIAHNKKKARA